MRNERDTLIEELLAGKTEELPWWAVKGPDCPDESVLVDTALGRADAAVVARVDQHEEDCPACRARMEAYRHTLREDAEDNLPVSGSLLERMARRVAGQDLAVPARQDTAQASEHVSQPEGAGPGGCA